MCGIAGLWRPNVSPDALRDTARAMMRALERRGPDGHGCYIDGPVGLALAHTRLSIRDLSESGAQPMRSADGRYVITYNGELYGTDNLRRELERGGQVFRGHSDTEVLLEAVAHHGVVAAVRRAEGIFAFAVWDTHERALWLVRDRAGIKPLYVATELGGGATAFASELGALKHVAGLDDTPDPSAAQAFFRLGYVPDTQSILPGVRKVQPGEAWRFSAAGGSPRVVVYHDREVTALRGQHALVRDPSEAQRRLSETLTGAVARQMVSDVPVGVFLSGGVDSSVVAAAAVRARGRGVRTFCIGFEDSRYDESRSASAIAKHLGTEHHELVVRPDEVVGSVATAAGAFSEPFADSSLVPTWLLCRFAREHVTVVLSGDGGDELFGGYNRHVWLPRVLQIQQLAPRALRHRLAALLSRTTPDEWDRLLTRVPIRTPGTKAHKLARLLTADGLARLVREVTSTGPLASGLLAGDLRDAPAALLQLDDLRSTLMHEDFVNYLPGDILPKVDRCSMFHSLEARVPLLDERMVELAAVLDPSLKIREGRGKWILRNVLAESVPRALFERPKTGFGVPLGDWLRGPLRDWAEDLLSPASLAGSPLIDAAAARAAWAALLNGRPMYEYGVWALLMWQTWRQGFGIATPRAQEENR